jgi:methyl-accepting chemotaxis protein
MQSIRSRLTLGLSIIILFFLTQAALVWWNQSTTSTVVVDTARKNTLASSQLGELAVLAQQVRRYEKEYFVYVGNTERRNGYIKEWTGTSDKISKLIGTIRSNRDGAFSREDVAKVSLWSDAADFYSIEMKKIFDQVDVQSTKVAQSVASATALADSPAKATTVKDSGLKAIASKLAAPAPAVEAVTPAVVMFAPAEVNTMIGAGKDRLSSVLIKGVSEMTSEKTKQTLGLADVASEGFNRVFYGVMATVAIGVLIALILIFKLPNAVTKPLEALTGAVENLSKGKLDAKIDSGGVAEFEGLSKALERMRIGQRALVNRMRAAPNVLN